MHLTKLHEKVNNLLYNRFLPWSTYLWVFFKNDLQVRYAWIEWVLPFQIVNLLIGVATWLFFGRTVGGQANLIEQQFNSNFISYLILGMAFNGLLGYSLDAYYGAYRRGLHGSIGIYGQSIGMLDYITLSGTPITAWMGGWIAWGYVENCVHVVIYLAIGHLFGLILPQSANYTGAILILFLGIIATSGLGLISASMIWIVGAWRGDEPIRWAIGLLVSLTSGVYFPPEVIENSWLETVAYLLPQTHALKAARLALLRSYSLDMLMPQITLLILYAVVLILIGGMMFRYSLSLSRKKVLIE